MPDSEPGARRATRVSEIMETAAGSAHADYQGYGKFWNLPLPELRGFTLYGVPMMRGAAPGPAAAAPAPSSCCHEPAGASAPPSGASGAGLPRGLRGQYPFDGTQYPPLPWGGTRVAESDIRFIEQWIADGCPGESDDTRAGIADTTARGQAAAGNASALTARTSSPTTLPGQGAPEHRVPAAGRSGALPRRHRADEVARRVLPGRAQRLTGRGSMPTSASTAGAVPHLAPGLSLRLRSGFGDRSDRDAYWDWAADVDNVKASMDDMESAGSTRLSRRPISAGSTEASRRSPRADVPARARRARDARQMLQLGRAVQGCRHHLRRRQRE